jgi:large subunit ribosomal protein L28
MSSGMKCANCGKGVTYGHEVSHAKNRSKRLFRPNLHTAKVIMNGILKRVKLCTKCLRILKKETLEKTNKSAKVQSPAVVSV